MDITTAKHGGVVVLTVSGRLDVNSSPDLEKQFLSLIDGGERWLVADLTGLSFISSAGLSVLLLAYRRVQSVKGKIHFCVTEGPVMQVFKLSGLSSRFDVFHSLQEASKDFPPEAVA